MEIKHESTRMKELIENAGRAGGEAVVSQDKTSDIIDASYYCENCKGQGKIIIKPSMDKAYLLEGKKNIKGFEDYLIDEDGNVYRNINENN